MEEGKEKLSNQFNQIASIVLAGVIGVLIAAPLALSYYRDYSLGVIILGLVGGLLVGYRRRRSRPFFYFCLVATLILSSLMFSSIDY